MVLVLVWVGAAEALLVNVFETIADLSDLQGKWRYVGGLPTAYIQVYIGGAQRG